MRAGFGRQSFGVLRQIVGDLVPGGLRADPGVVLRSDPGVAVHRPQPDRDLVAIRPRSPEETRAAHLAEDLDRGIRRGAVHDQPLGARYEPEVLAPDAALGPGGRAAVLPAARAVAVPRAQERAADDVAHGPAEAAAGQRMAGRGRVRVHIGNLLPVAAPRKPAALFNPAGTI